jgi:hypothetical protein
MATYACKYHYSSQWYDQAEEDYVPKIEDGSFDVTADNLDEAVAKAQAEVARMNRTACSVAAIATGDDPKRFKAFPTNFLEEVRGPDGVRTIRERKTHSPKTTGA